MASPNTSVKEVRKGPVVVAGIATAVGGCLGRFEKGPLNKAILVTGGPDAKEIFGDSPPSDSYTQSFLEGFFSNEGASAYLVRILGAGYAAATKNLQSTVTGASSGTVKTSAVFPVRLSDGDTFIGKVDGGSALTATIIANRAKIDGSGATYAAAAGNLNVIINGFAKTIVFAGTENTQALWFNTINTQLRYATVLNNAGQTRIQVDAAGTASSGSVVNTSTPAVLASLGLTASAFTLAAGSNVANVDAVTALEFKALQDATFTGSVTTVNGDGTASWTSSTTGGASSVQYTAGSGVTKIITPSGDFTVHSGSGTTPVDVLKVDASSPGAWGVKYRVKPVRVDTVIATLSANYAAGAATAVLGLSTAGRVFVGDTLSIDNGTAVVRANVTGVDGASVNLDAPLTVPSGGWTTATNVVSETLTLYVYDKNGILEKTFDKLRMNSLAGVNYIQNKINNAPRSAIDVIVLGSAADDKRPTTLTSPVYLTGGSDGAAPNASDYIGVQSTKTGLYAFDRAVDVNMVSVCGVSDPLVTKAMETYGEYRGDVVMIPDAPISNDETQVKTYARTTVNFASSQIAMYFPWFLKAESGTGGVVTVPNSGYIQGIVARTHKNRNFGKAPAGIVDGQVRGIVGLEYNIDSVAYDPLYDANVNAVMNFPGEGIAVWGSRTMDPTGEFGQLSTRIVFNIAKREIRKRTRFVNFEPNNADTQGSVRRILTSLFRGWRESLILAGSNDKEAFFVICDMSNNTATVRAANKFVCRIGLATQNPSEFQEYTLELDTRAIDAALAATGT